MRRKDHRGRSSLLQAEQVGTTMISCADLEAFAKRANLIPAAKQPLPNAPAAVPILLSALGAVAQHSGRLYTACLCALRLLWPTDAVLACTINRTQLSSISNRQATRPPRQPRPRRRPSLVELKGRAPGIRFQRQFANLCRSFN